MRVRQLFDGPACEIVATMDGNSCPTLAFIEDDDANTQGYRDGLVEILGHVSELGLQGVPSAWWHEANKRQGIYEFRKGPLRLFFFKGAGRQVAVCTTGVRKQGPKADKAAVRKAAELRKEYEQAIAAQSLEVVEDEN